MNDIQHLPAETTSWLRETNRRLRTLPHDYRAEVLAGLSEHLAELTANGLTGAEAVTRLGSPSSVAEDALTQYQQQSGADRRPHYFTTKRILQLVALTLAVAGALAVLLLPGYLEVTESADGTAQVDSATILEVAGPWYLLVLTIPVALTALPLFARGRAWQPLAVACVVLLTTFIAIGMFSIGWYFIFAWAVAVASLFLPARSRVRRDTVPT